MADLGSMIDFAVSQPLVSAQKFLAAVDDAERYEERSRTDDRSHSWRRFVYRDGHDRWVGPRPESWRKLLSPTWASRGRRTRPAGSPGTPRHVASPCRRAGTTTCRSSGCDVRDGPLTRSDWCRWRGSAARRGVRRPAGRCPARRRRRPPRRGPHVDPALRDLDRRGDRPAGARRRITRRSTSCRDRRRSRRPTAVLPGDRHAPARRSRDP